jgi:hypothetical protein
VRHARDHERLDSAAVAVSSRDQTHESLRRVRRPRLVVAQVPLGFAAREHHRAPGQGFEHVDQSQPSRSAPNQRQGRAHRCDRRGREVDGADDLAKQRARRRRAREPSGDRPLSWPAHLVPYSHGHGPLRPLSDPPSTHAGHPRVEQGMGQERGSRTTVQRPVNGKELRAETRWSRKGTHRGGAQDLKARRFNLKRPVRWMAPAIQAKLLRALLSRS